MAMFGQDAFGMKLHAFDVLADMPDAHDLAVACASKQGPGEPLRWNLGLTLVTAGILFGVWAAPPVHAKNIANSEVLTRAGG